jgi:hypothetical protein
MLVCSNARRLAISLKGLMVAARGAKPVWLQECVLI